MTRWLRVAGAIDRVNGAVGRGASWLALAMVLVGAFNALARYLGRWIGWNLSSNLYLELQWYLFSALFLLAAAWVLRQDAHVRVDVIYGRLPAKAMAWIDVAGHVLLLLPFCAATFLLSVPSVRSSWAIREGSPDPGGLARYPLKTLVLVCFALLALQGIAELLRDVAILRGLEPGGERRHEPEATGV